MESVSETKHLKITASASNAVVRPFQLIRLRLDAQTKGKMHVYAPGVTGYKPIAWEIDPSPAFTTRKLTYPTAKRLHLKAIQETLDVYEGAFTLQVEIAMVGHPDISKATGVEQLRVTGKLIYQACDGKTCYLPVTVPVEWALRYENLQEGRVPEHLQHRKPH